MYVIIYIDYVLNDSIENSNLLEILNLKIFRNTSCVLSFICHHKALSKGADR